MFDNILKNLLVFVYRMFEEMNVFKNFNLNTDSLLEFFLAVRKGYNPNPYHNWMHAVDVIRVQT